MKKIKLSLAALALVLAIAGTTSVNATKAKAETPWCSQVDPNACPNQVETACCLDDATWEVVGERAKPH
ncbi:MULTISPECIES: hypothetical protein [Niastella]|uniref:Membrane or secreted protein n=1 Tax=Niastella soli TaxID=2821487 RepID=A0ABS3YYF9_9BACT|nr:hypothetical protein [Niastella soli]MBO9202954.1 hypothetical protein [Niastella soli]